MISNLHRKVSGLEDTIDQLSKSKIRLVQATSREIELMRDQITDLTEKLIATGGNKVLERDEEEEKKEGEAGHDPNNASFGWGVLSYARSKFSTPNWKHKVNDTKKSKINLVNSTSTEIDRLRGIIRVLARQETPGNRTTKNTHEVSPKQLRRQASELPDDPEGAGMKLHTSVIPLCMSIHLPQFHLPLCLHIIILILPSQVLHNQTYTYLREALFPPEEENI